MQHKFSIIISTLLLSNSGISFILSLTSNSSWMALALVTVSTVGSGAIGLSSLSSTLVKFLPRTPYELCSSHQQIMHGDSYNINESILKGSYLNHMLYLIQYLYNCPRLAYNGPRPEGTKSYNQVLYIYNGNITTMFT